MACLFYVLPMMSEGSLGVWHWEQQSTSCPQFIRGTLLVKPARKHRRHWAIVGSMLVQRLRRWPNIEPTIAQCLLFAGQLPVLLSSRDQSLPKSHRQPIPGRRPTCTATCCRASQLHSSISLPTSAAATACSQRAADGAEITGTNTAVLQCKAKRQ